MNFVKNGLLLSAVLTLSLTTVAAVPKKISKVKGSSTVMTSVETTRVMNALKLPTKNGLAVLKPNLKKNFFILKSIAFNDTHPTATRWKALTTLSILGGKAAAKSLKKAAASSEWFMRNAALVSASRVSKEFAGEMAHKLLQDRSLIVRSAAAKVLGDLKIFKYKTVLQDSLKDAHNYRGGKSLWVRKHIAEALYKMIRVSDNDLFKQMLYDADSHVQKVGVQGLERIHQKRLSESPQVSTHVDLWKKSPLSI